MSQLEDGQRVNPGGKQQQQTPGARSLKGKSIRQSPRTDDPKSQGERDFRGKSSEELREMLQRQQKLLENRSFINKLPDKGKKISDFAEKLKTAITEHEELQSTTKLLSDFKISFQENLNNLNKIEDRTRVPTDHPDAVEVEAKTKKIVENSSNFLDKDQNHGNAKSINIALSDSKWVIGGQQLSTNELISGLEQVKIVDEVTDNEPSHQKPEKVRLKKTVPFLVPMQKKLHYIEVLENRADHPISARQKFRPNQLSGGSNESSHSSSPGQSSARVDSTMSAEERQMRDKHRADFTSARVPPLHHMPAQLLPIEESVTLQMIQKVAYEEMQAKLAAQKLAERLNIKMVKYNPDDGESMKYREVCDEDYYSEDEIGT